MASFRHGPDDEQVVWLIIGLGAWLIFLASLLKFYQ